MKTPRLKRRLTDWKDPLSLVVSSSLSPYSESGKSMATAHRTLLLSSGGIRALSTFPIIWMPLLMHNRHHNDLITCLPIKHVERKGSCYASSHIAINGRVELGINENVI